MSTYVGHSRASSLDHFVRLDPGSRKPYSGMTGRALCGAKVGVTEKTVGTHPDYVQPVGTCKRCAAVLGQKVRVPVIAFLRNLEEN